MGCCCCLLPDGAKAEKIRRKIEKLREDRKATRSLGKDLEESVDLRSHAPGMQWERLRAGVRVEGRGTRNRGDREGRRFVSGSNDDDIYYPCFIRPPLLPLDFCPSLVLDVEDGQIDQTQDPGSQRCITVSTSILESMSAAQTAA